MGSVYLSAIIDLCFPARRQQKVKTQPGGGAMTYMLDTSLCISYHWFHILQQKEVLHLNVILLPGKWFFWHETGTVIHAATLLSPLTAFSLSQYVHCDLCIKKSSKEWMHFLHSRKSVTMTALPPLSTALTTKCHGNVMKVVLVVINTWSSYKRGKSVWNSSSPQYIWQALSIWFCCSAWKVSTLIWNIGLFHLVSISHSNNN